MKFLPLLLFVALVVLAGRLLPDDNLTPPATAPAVITASSAPEPTVFQPVPIVPVTTTTTVPAQPVVARARTAPTVATGDVWDLVADCESGGRWDDTRGGYEGGLHFLHDTWVKAGGRQFAEHAYLASRADQITVARSWLRRTSVRQWPICGPRAGLTMADAA